MNGQKLPKITKEKIKKGNTPDRFFMKIVNCARCQKDHEKLLFKKLQNSCLTFTHFSICPTNKEPLLLKINEAFI